VNIHTLKVLEYNTIVERLAWHCRSVPGKRKAAALLPQRKKAAIEQSLDLIEEMNDLFQYDGGPPDLAFDDLAVRLDSAISSGTIFEPRELLSYSALFATVRECQNFNVKYNKLKTIADDLVYPEDLHREIVKSVDEDGLIKDTASPELFDIRKELSKIKTKLDAKFEKFLNSDMQTYLSDKLFTIREGRYVLPVRESDKGHVGGIIHDRSSSGATFFIEPAETVELNNRHRELETAEREEINRILRRLTEMLFISSEVVNDDVEILSRIDFIAGCSRLSRELLSTRPLISESRSMKINNGRHPILILSASRGSERKVVPLSVRFTDDSNILIITGPNTGGKTVALKTIGLLSLMAASGLFVSADKDSEFVLFDDIFADIGDEQSIDSSLSTYSSHLSHIKSALDESNHDSFVMLDELGAGTDPDEGSALGQAIIEFLSSKRCFAVITTHHGKLKTLAGKVPGVVNGSMEFDTENLNPTFRFLPEIPGSSYAVEIARRLGITDAVTKRAMELLDSGERDLTNVLTELHSKSRQLADELEKATEDRERYESLVGEYEAKLEDQRRAEKQYRKDQLQKTEKIIAETKAQLDKMIEKAKADKADVESLRRTKKEVQEKLSRTREKIREMTPRPAGDRASGLPGESVYVVGVEADGEVLEPADSAGRVKVRVGNVTMVTDLAKLLKKNKVTRTPAVAASKTDYAPEPGMELDIRGTTFEEAEPLIERYIDDALTAGLGQISIIHGKGTGALRRKVQNYLSKNGRIESFRLGNWNEGSSGVTIVTLKTDRA